MPQKAYYGRIQARRGPFRPLSGPYGHVGAAERAAPGHLHPAAQAAPVEDVTAGRLHDGLI